MNSKYLLVYGAPRAGKTRALKESISELTDRDKLR
jgi:Cdc6-like AAA superfamily ATPase